jgi:hypothetical protein
MSTVDEKIDRLILMVEHMDRKFEGKIDSLATEVHEFRYEMMQERTMLRNQIAAVTEALNSTIAENDAAHAEIIQVQEQHSIDITKLRAAI